MTEYKKVFVVLYHDRWEHCECINDCCGAETTEVKGVATSRELAEGIINNLLQRCGHERDEYEIQKEDLVE
jgi:hypothetical protein